MKTFFSRIGLYLILLAGGASAGQAMTFKESDFKQWGTLAIQDNGRRKPIDTYAREAVLKLTGRESYKDASGRVWQPGEMLLSILLGDAPGVGKDFDWTKQPLVLINYRPLVEKLGLDREQKRFTFEELAKSQELNRLAGEVHQLSLQKAELDRMQTEVRTVSERMTLFNNLNRGAALLIVPPRPDATVKDAWVVPPDAAKTFGEAKFKPATERLQAMVKAYVDGDAFNFSLRARELRQELRSLCSAVYPSEGDLGREYFYNQLAPFSRAAIFYAFGLVLLAAGSLPSGISRWLRYAGVTIGLGGLIFHAWGIALRCMIAGRPPVTNMFESMVWVAFVAALFGFLFFLRYRSTTYLLAALPVSFLTVTILLQAPAAMPPSIDPLQPVLRDNFWLTIHVLTITASYGAFLLALGFGHIVLFRYLLNPQSARSDAPLHFWLYRVIQLGVLLIAAGTILGGVWANYSWGRFWGWDPKETWALITLLCYIVALHGRIAGYWSHFGLAVASVLCFAAVVMAWYGLNFWFPSGLHSYGRGVGGEGWAATILGIDLVFLGIVCWRKRAAEPTRRTAPAVRDREVAADGVETLPAPSL